MRALRAPRASRLARLVGGDAAVLAILLVVFLVTASRHSQFATNQATGFGLFLLLACSMQLMLGFSNQASRMHAAVYGAGAYVAVELEAKAGVPPVVALLGALAAGAVLGGLLALPLSRLREHFFAMAALAAQVIFTQVFQDLSGITGGVNGEATANPHLDSLPLLALILGVGFAVAAATRALKASRLGRRVLALRADETMARSVGVDIARMRLVMVVLSFALASGSGFFLVETSGYISPDSFTLTTSLAVLVAVIVGGRSLTWGALVGAGAYSALNGETTNDPGLSVLVLGIALVVVLAYLPEGITGFRLPAFLRRVRAQDGDQRADAAGERLHAGGEMAGAGDEQEASPSLARRVRASSAAD